MLQSNLHHCFTANFFNIFKARTFLFSSFKVEFYYLCGLYQCLSLASSSLWRDAWNI